MNQQQLESALRETLEDRRLSRGERRALSEILRDVDPSATHLGAIRSTAFALAREVIDEMHPPRDVLQWLEGVVKLLTPGTDGQQVRLDACFSPGEECRRRIRGLFRHATRCADVCVFTITDNQITEEIIDAHRRGVRIRIITDNDKSLDRGSDIENMQRCGISVRYDLTRHHMHHKFAVFDRTTVLTGSYNWTVSASKHNEENLIVTDAPSLVRAFGDTFDRLWSQFDLPLPPPCQERLTEP